ncbi:MAG: DoxX family membrane protein [Candidatus Eremiobacteraeota bacterium]|nr:DoxX family membrane protein [Candidatus Eremiobacteraeota bacterium]
MNIVRIVARIFLGIVFLVAGGFSFFISNPPPQPGMAGAFNTIFVHSHWSLFVGAAQVVIGVLLLINRYVPLALTLLFGFVYNSFAFHITMAPIALPAPVLVTILGLTVAWPYRALFAHLFAAQPRVEPPAE